MCFFFFFQAEDGIRDYKVTGVQTCALPICGKKFGKIEAHGIAVRDEFDLSAETPLLMVEVLDGGKLEIGHYDLVARPAKIKAGGNDRLSESDILVQRNLTGARANQGGNFVADGNSHFPPALFPSAHAAAGPRISIGMHFVVNAARHGSERIADEIGGAVKDGKFAAPFEKLIHIP